MLHRDWFLFAAALLLVDLPASTCVSYTACAKGRTLLCGGGPTSDDCSSGFLDAVGVVCGGSGRGVCVRVCVYVGVYIGMDVCVCVWACMEGDGDGCE